jgi:hypothetical protein
MFSPVCLHFLKKNVLQYNDVEVFYSSQSKRIVDSGITNILTPHLPAINFVDRLQYVLNRIQSKYVFLVQEDHWYTEPIHKLNELISVCDQFQLDQLKLFPIASFGLEPSETIYRKNELQVVWSGKCNYPVSHHATIFNRVWLLRNLKESAKNKKITPWQHEYYNLKYKNDIKRSLSDNKSLRIAQVTRSNMDGLYSVIRRGKLNDLGLRVLYSNESVAEIKTLLKMLEKSSFI